MTPDEIKQRAALVALNAMMKKGWMDICTINQVAEMLEVQPDKQAHDVLRSLHCVHFDQMPRDLHQEIPALIQRALCGADVFQFELRSAQPIPLRIEPKRPLLLRVFGKSA